MYSASQCDSYPLKIHWEYICMDLSIYTNWNISSYIDIDLQWTVKWKGALKCELIKHVCMQLHANVIKWEQRHTDVHERLSCHPSCTPCADWQQRPLIPHAPAIDGFSSRCTCIFTIECFSKLVTELRRNLVNHMSFSLMVWKKPNTDGLFALILF